MIDYNAIESWPVWENFETINLEDMGKVKLMNRIDTKFLVPASMLPELLARSQRDYCVQVIGDKRVASYDSLYFDTADLEMYTKHQDKKLQRNKVRTRSYVESGIAFLEIKHKNNKGRTKKKRVQIPVADFENFFSNVDAVGFLKTQVKYDPQELLPQLHTIFRRITLVDKEKTERLTIDMDLRFVNVQTGNRAELGPLLIIELKQDGMVQSKMRNILLDMHIHPFSMSKYCIGTVMTNPNAKHNRFKKKIQRINKLTNPI
ncbi:MAG: polyphosphate polymerase domain-containing protein [Paludibacteraceae bacterium]|nr:polyphosphate polymerase domain-containing protein [Paludibacteraceae bacterium]